MARFALPTLGLVVILAACATSTRPQQWTAMVAPKAPLSFHDTLRGGIAVVEIVGGEKTDVLHASRGGDREFADAVRGTLANHGLLAAPEDTGRYTLRVALAAVEPPVGGFHTRVVSVIRYRLARAEDGTAVMDEVVATPGRATMKDTILAIRRMQFATEAAVRSNLGEFLERLARFRPG